MATLTEKGLGMKIMYQTDDYEDWQTLTPDLRKFLTMFNKQTKKFNRIRYKVAGITTYESSVFLGLEILEGQNLGII